MLRHALCFLALPLLLAGADTLSKDLAYRFDLARQLPPPIAADAILNLIEKFNLTGPLARDYSAEAYRLAFYSSGKPYLAYAGKQLLYDRVLNPRNYGRFHPVSLGLRAYAIHWDNSPDKKKLDIDEPKFTFTPRLNCEVFFTPDPGEVYSTMLRSKSSMMRFYSFSSAIDLARYLEAFLAVNAKPQANIENLLRSVSDGDRGFFYAMRRLHLHDAVLKFAKDSDKFARQRILMAYREFLLRHFQQKRCPDLAQESYAGILEEFNAALEATSVATMALKPEDARVRAVDTTEAEPAFFDAASSQILQRIRSATLDDTEVSSLLNQIFEWKAPDKVPTAQALGIRSSLYKELVDALGTSYLTDRAAREWVAFLGRDSVRSEAIPVWYFSVQAIASSWVNGNKYRMVELETGVDPALAALTTLQRLDREGGNP